MNDLIASIEATRRIGNAAIESALNDLSGQSEQAVHRQVAAKLQSHTELFSEGWYAPPPQGVSVLFDGAPFTRLQYESIRDEIYFPQDTQLYGEESVGLFYVSPIAKDTGMFGDTGLTVYTGNDHEICDHVRVCHDLVLAASEKAEVGKTFAELYSEVMESFASAGKQIAWMKTQRDPYETNLGHTAPGSYGDGSVLGSSLEETREAIRARRVFVGTKEDFIIPKTCAFTLEARLTDMEAVMPNTFFHIIVLFQDGEKKVLADFNDLFQTIGMNYMLK